MLDRLNPFLRYARVQYVRVSGSRRCIAVDHRLFYAKQHGLTVIADVEYHIPEGGAIYLPARTPYTLASDTRISQAAVFDFDLTADHSSIRESLHTAELSRWDGSALFCEEPLEEFSQIIVFSDAKRAEGMLLRTTELFAAEEPMLWRELASAYFKAALLTMLTENSAVLPPAVRIACDYIREHFAGELTCSDAAKAAGYHPNHLNRLFRLHLGMGVREYIIAFRIREAKKLLVDPGVSIVETALACGFCDASYFSQCFRKYTGMTPREFRRTGMLP